jgi:hypothetical protein
MLELFFVGVLIGVSKWGWESDLSMHLQGVLSIHLQGDLSIHLQGDLLKQF